MKNLNRYILILGLLTLSGVTDAIAQKKKTTRVVVEYVKNYDQTEGLVATLRVKEERYLGLNDAQVEFYSLTDTSEILLDKVRTDLNGEALYLFGDISNIFKDSSGLMTFEIRYQGSSSTKSSKRKVSAKRSNLDISFLQKENVKSIEVRAEEIGKDGQLIPLKDEDIQFYIKGTFSLLKLEKTTTDNNGIAQIEFPVNMPGDTAGVLTIVAKLEEHKTFGTVESRGEMNWAIQLEPAKEKQRGLGDTDAPLWMVYTLIILLSAVWFHYFYVIYLIVKIKLAKGV